MLYLDKTKETKCLKNIVNPTCVLDSAEEHLLTLCRPRNVETQTREIWKTFFCC